MNKTKIKVLRMHNQRIRKQNEGLAKRVLLDNIDPSRISYQARRTHYDGTPLITDFLLVYGLIISKPTLEEQELLIWVNDLCDWGIKQLVTDYQIPGDVTDEEKEKFTRIPDVA